MSPGSLYVIRILNFGTTVPDEGVYLSNIETMPSVAFSLQKADKSVFGGPYPFVNYLKNNEVNAFFWSNIQQDNLRGTFRGLLGQNASLAGVTEITAHVSLNIFEITDAEFLKAFFGIFGQAAGAVLGVPKELERRI